MRLNERRTKRTANGFFTVRRAGVFGKELNAMAKNKELSFADKIWYGTGAVGLDLSYGMFYGKLNRYLTDVLNLGPGFLTVLTALARIWDGINDPMMGSIVDNSFSKRGKYRPWVIRGALLNAVVLFFLFFNPGFDTSSHGIGIYVYIAFMYVLWGMTNTMADIPYWSMVPSFTTDPGERSIIATVARTFSGLGQGIVEIGAPILLNRFGVLIGENNYRWTQKGYTVCVLICSLSLVFFAFLSMSRVKETVQTKPKDKFSFRQIFDVIKNNDQLRIFMLFAMLSNAGFYTTSGVKDYFFGIVLENSKAQSLFNTFGAVGSIAGLAVIPVMMKFTTRRRTYQFSLSLALAGYIGMFLSGQILASTMLLNIFFLITQIGTASMFVSQTVFLSDVVDYGEVKTGDRKESVTFSMKGFLQKMAYTLQTIILFSVLGAVGYKKCKPDANGIIVYPAKVKNAVAAVMYIIPPVFFLLSIIVFSTCFKLHGAYMEDITAKVTAAREKRMEQTQQSEN